MTLGRLLRIALGEVGHPLWRSWPLSLGIALGVATLLTTQGLADGVAAQLRARLLGSMPDRLRVEPGGLSVGPLKVQGALDPATLDKLRGLPGVRALYRQARFPEPVQLQASLGGHRFWSDVVLEGVDPGLVEGHLARGQRFEDPGGSGSTTPAVMPRIMLDVLSAGVSLSTGLPALSPELVQGRRFTLHLGTSSFVPTSQGRPAPTRECRIVGLSDQVGIGGPSIPYDALERWSGQPLRVHAVTLELSEPSATSQVVTEIERMHLRAPGLEAARQIGEGLRQVHLLLALFGAAILMVAGVGIFTGLSLQTRQEAPTIGLYRALGATRRDIQTLYLLRAGLLGTAGALAGAAGGWLLGRGIGLTLQSGAVDGGDLFLPGGLTLAAPPLFGLVTALLAAWAPARQAARLAPAEALRRG